MVEDGAAFSAWGGTAAAPSPLQEGHAGSVLSGGDQGSASHVEGAMPTQQWWPPPGPAPAQSPATQPMQAPWPAPGLPAPVHPAQSSWLPAQPQAGNMSDRTTSAADLGSAAWGFGGYPAPATAPAMGQPAPAEASSSSWGGKGGGRDQAAWALYWHQWAAQMGQYGWPSHPAMPGYGAPATAYGMTPPPYGAASAADGTNPQASGWPGPPQAAAPWPGWGEAPQWPLQSNGPGPATAPPAPSVPQPEGQPESPTSGAAAAAGVTVGNQIQTANHPTHATEIPAEVSHQMKGDGEQEAAAPGAAVSSADNDLCQDISSAVALFLAGNDDGFDSDDDDDGRVNDDCETSAAAPAPVALPTASTAEAESSAAAPAAAAAAIQAPPATDAPSAAPPATTTPPFYATLPVAGWSTAPAMVTSPPPGLSGIATPPQASNGAPATLQNGTPPKTAAVAGHGRTAQLPVAGASMLAGSGSKPAAISTPVGNISVTSPPKPSAAGMQDFLNVLRRRPLPADITEEKRHQINKALFTCVMSLYRDRIKPVQNHLQRRLRERNLSDSAVMAVLLLCAREPETYRIMPPMQGQQPIILLVEEPLWFNGWVDVEGPESNFGPDAWEAFHGFLNGEDAVLPSQPYQAAVELRQRSLPGLQKLCLGELEHMVRQAIGRNLLKHHGDSLKAVQLAKKLEAFDKERKSRPFKADIDMFKGKVTGVSAAATPDAIFAGDITDGDDLTVVLLQLMQRFPNGVALSLMKHYVQSYCRRNLNEAHFKCSKLAEVFKLAPLNQIFPLETRSRSEIIVKPPKPNAIPVHIWQKFYHLRDMPPAGAPPDVASDTALSGVVHGPAKKAPPPPPPPPPPSMSSTSDGSVAAKGMRLQ